MADTVDEGLAMLVSGNESRAEGEASSVRAPDSRASSGAEELERMQEAVAELGRAVAELQEAMEALRRSMEGGRE